jgi:CubicO group peptidase (beta-lactamase class C family)
VAQRTHTKTTDELAGWKFHAHTFLSVILVVISSTWWADMGGESEVKQLDSFVQKQVDADEFSGCVLVAKDWKPIFRKAYGLACRRFNIPNQIDTKFNLGSCNKAFTQVAIVQFAEHGKLSLEDYVSQHLPNYPSSVANKVTINHLLSHTSGLGDYFNEKFETSRHKLRTVDDFLSLFINDPLSFEPGTKVQYSNAGYVVLGKIIEVLSGQDYYEYVRKHIYRLAGMNDTDHYELDLPIPNLAMGYTKMSETENIREGPRRNNIFFIGVKGSPAGGGYSTVDDMLKFCTALCSCKLLNPEYTELVLRPKRVQTTKEARPRIFGHAGGFAGVGSIFKIYLDLGYVSIVLSNYDPDAMWTIDKRIEDIILHLR